MKLWERIGMGFSIVAVIGTLGFSIWDKIDYRMQIAKSEEQIAKNAYDKLYSDVSQGFYSGTKLREAINRILEHGDDLSGMNLSNKWLPGINLKGENLYAINISESTFYKKGEKSDFSRANLGNADLTGANLTYANLQEANFRHASLQGAHFVQTNLQEANFRHANLQEADFFSARLQKASLIEANLQGARFRQAKLQGADLSFANLKEADFLHANLQGASLMGTDLVSVKWLYIEQLSKVKTLFQAKLDPELKEQIKGKYPHLLKEQSWKEMTVLRKLKIPRYTDNEYELQSDGKVVYDKTTKLMWQQAGSEKILYLSEKKSYIAQLNRDKYAGYNNWRLPTVKEAITLIEQEMKIHGLYINPVFDKKQRRIWTFDRAQYDIWVVNFSNGGCDNGFADYGYYVRAVR
ncbi:MAG: DUF1566 domain-containing protein [Candidatus Brocadiaceae bacterium]|nr:DUF1566 domain-containing protein [Candidatus Brocadiaceae bacterium]